MIDIRVEWWEEDLIPINWNCKVVRGLQYWLFSLNGWEIFVLTQNLKNFKEEFRHKQKPLNLPGNQKFCFQNLLKTSILCTHP